MVQNNGVPSIRFSRRVSGTCCKSLWQGLHQKQRKDDGLTSPKYYSRDAILLNTPYYKTILRLMASDNSSVYYKSSLAFKRMPLPFKTTQLVHTSLQENESNTSRYSQQGPIIYSQHHDQRRTILDPATPELMPQSICTIDPGLHIRQTSTGSDLTQGVTTVRAKQCNTALDPTSRPFTPQSLYATGTHLAARQTFLTAQFIPMLTKTASSSLEYQQNNFLQDGDDGYWTDDEIFIPGFCGTRPRLALQRDSVYDSSEQAGADGYNTDEQAKIKNSYAGRGFLGSARDDYGASGDTRTRTRTHIYVGEMLLAIPARH